MIDASRSPRAAWQRYATIAALVVLILLGLLFIWKKELHHSSSQSQSTPPAPVATSPAKSTTPAATQGIMPGGVSISNRNPFQG